MPEELPEGAKSLFLSSKTQELFNLGEATSERPVVIVEKADIIQDTIKRAAVSDFSPIKKKIQEYPEDQIVLIADVDYKFGENFFIILSVEAKDALLVAPEVRLDTICAYLVMTYIPRIITSPPHHQCRSQLKVKMSWRRN